MGGGAAGTDPGSVPSGPRSSPSKSGVREEPRAPRPGAGPRRPARRVAFSTSQGAAPSGSISSGDARAAAATSSSSSRRGRNGRRGDEAITVGAKVRRREQRPAEEAAFNQAVAQPPGRTRLPVHTPLGGRG